MSKPVVPLISIRIPSVWGMTLLRNGRIKDDVISTHIPRRGDDHPGNQARLPHRISIHIQGLTIPAADKFQSTSPVGGMTPQYLIRFTDRWISIHIPRGGDDTCRLAGGSRWPDFNPHPPWGG